MRAAAALLSVLLLTSCGTRAERPPEATAPTPTPSASETAAPLETVDPSFSAPPRPSGTDAPVVSGSGAPAPSLPPASPVTGPLKVGILTGDRPTFTALVAAWNKRGGLGGRQVQPVWSASPATACTDLGTADIALVQALTATLAPCLQMPVLSSDVALGEVSPSLTALSALTLDDRVRLVLTRALDPADGALGVVVEDCPVEKRTVARTLTPTAKQRKYTVAATATVACGKVDDLTKAVASLSGKDVKQVVVVSGDHEAAVVRSLTKAAAAKRFAPTYGVTSAAGPAGLTTQRERVVGVGWVPSLDVPGATASATVNTCLRDLRAGGGARPATAAQRFITYGACDLLRLADAVLRTGRGSITPAAVKAQGRTFRSAVVMESSTDFSRRQTGPAVARTFAWSTDCTCFAYTGNRFAL